MNRKLAIPLICLAALLLSMACTLTIPGGLGLRGSGNVITESRQVSDFNQVVLSGIGELQITQGESESLEIEAEDNLLPLIETEVRNNTLYIGIKENRTGISPTKPIRYQLSLKELDSLEISGAGSAKVDVLETETLDLMLSGVGAIKVGTLTADTLAVAISGAGNCQVAGQVQRLKVDMSGAGSLEAGDLQAQTADVQISGVGGAKLWVSETLDAVLSGVGNLEYYGNPSVTMEESGVGRMKSLGDK
ncbi:MAG: head GIN domain-containing protein [Chloroflexota bacterium]